MAAITDGLIEEHEAGGEQFGVEQLIDWVNSIERAEKGVRAVVRSLSHALMEERGGTTSDDATLLLIEWRGALPTTSPPWTEPKPKTLRPPPQPSAAPQLNEVPGTQLPLPSHGGPLTTDRHRHSLTKATFPGLRMRQFERVLRGGRASGAVTATLWSAAVPFPGQSGCCS
ncbi:serine/threonine-protein phosphatase [Streptomyces decoyicus]|uniref:Serine/threonine-protein phosphatase n=1 Tax=Streptomyces decoyicus TaxID=249567 RepID=A0ABZ1F9X3_9ACTN|nr:SpoIIE family protein phosphatase [Streptomyces decoyicus]WSB67141.1 serine/threonine-protein phosphatase [Streptomyces decoyicus]